MKYATRNPSLLAFFILLKQLREAKLAVESEKNEKIAAVFFYAELVLTRMILLDRTKRACGDGKLSLLADPPKGSQRGQAAMKDPRVYLAHILECIEPAIGRG